MCALLAMGSKGFDGSQQAHVGPEGSECLYFSDTVYYGLLGAGIEVICMTTAKMMHFDIKEIPKCPSSGTRFKGTCVCK